MRSFCIGIVSYHIFPENKTVRMICEKSHSIPCSFLSNFTFHIRIHNAVSIIFYNLQHLTILQDTKYHVGSKKTHSDYFKLGTTRKTC